MSTPEELQARWRKSTYSGAVENNCVEIADLNENIGIRDSKNPGAAHLTLTRQDFTALVARLAARR